jgi:aspartyl-tRNA(Asn)/glutamyl-tRNA(Gln) amidotransferase subunit B
VYLSGKEGLLGFFIGQVMRSFDGSPDPAMVRKLLIEHINQRAEETD